jgi:hypothetical protein
MQLFVRGMRILLSAGTIGCIALSCYFAFEFGFTRGASLRLAWAYGLVAATLDFFKCGILLISEDKPRGQRTTSWVGYVVLACLSMWCAYGITATQGAEKTVTKQVAASSRELAQRALDRLQGQRDALVFTETTEEMVEAASRAVKTAHEQVEAEKARNGCKEICRDREKDERAATAALQKAQTDRAATIKAAALDAEIEKARKVLEDPITIEAAAKQVDPQTEHFSQATGAGLALSALLSYGLLALGIEIGSGLMPWLLWGHGKGPDPAPTKVAPEIVPETPVEGRARFFREVVIPVVGEHVAGSDVYSAYAKWCSEQDLTPMTPQAFGTKPPWPKDKSGRSWYRDCRLATGYAPQRLLLASSRRT